MIFCYRNCKHGCCPLSYILLVFIKDVIIRYAEENLHSHVGRSTDNVSAFSGKARIKYSPLARVAGTVSKLLKHPAFHIKCSLM